MDEASNRLAFRWNKRFPSAVCQSVAILAPCDIPVPERGGERRTPFRRDSRSAVSGKGRSLRCRSARPYAMRVSPSGRADIFAWDCHGDVGVTRWAEWKAELEQWVRRFWRFFDFWWDGALTVWSGWIYKPLIDGAAPAASGRLRSTVWRFCWI
ncbi:hypothetical protein GCM10011390_35180 [Aureimonas endophytica]|uniref:Uncharacterized protein n=1 Tax=Aureimonas endophytica TaxID=2027858 RepID=A0A917E7Z6_9HYPH|nr:hypothetical protein GCM10011390_35180 [Aureimonas endophytica]